jgi:hypothetical protein
MILWWAQALVAMALRHDPQSVSTTMISVLAKGGGNPWIGSGRPSVAAFRALLEVGQALRALAIRPYVFIFAVRSSTCLRLRASAAVATRIISIDMW